MRPPGPSRTCSPDLFNRIASRYDLMNRIMTLGLDIRWRRTLAEKIPSSSRKILDCATGTGDQMVAILDAHPDCEEIWGADPAERMLERAKEKLSLSPHQHKVHFVAARADELPFENEYFDAISISFGIRNVPDVHATLVAMKKILKREGKLLILECSKPERLFFARLQKYFLRYGISALGRLITGDYSAYLYLADTVATFPSGENFCKLMRQAGFIECTMTPFCFGMTTLYVGI